jgi:hypothetical protein
VPCRPDSRTSAASNFHTNASLAQTKGMVVQKVDQMHIIFIFDASAPGERGLTSGCLDFECNTCLMDEHVRKGIHGIRTVAAIFP